MGVVVTGSAFTVICMSCQRQVVRHSFQSRLTKLNPYLSVKPAEIRPDGDVDLTDVCTRYEAFFFLCFYSLISCFLLNQCLLCSLSPPTPIFCRKRWTASRSPLVRVVVAFWNPTLCFSGRVCRRSVWRGSRSSWQSVTGYWCWGHPSLSTQATGQSCQEAERTRHNMSAAVGTDLTFTGALETYTPMFFFASAMDSGVFPLVILVCQFIPSRCRTTFFFSEL